MRPACWLLLVVLLSTWVRAQHVDPQPPWGDEPVELMSFVAAAFTPEAVVAQEEAAWSMVPALVDRIRPPTFPARECAITDYGATPDDGRDDRPAILAALADCASQGGGRVVIPPGAWLSNGPIHLESNIDLHLQRGATLRFGTNPSYYTPLVLVRWEGVFAYNYSPLIYARGKENLAITGEGTIDGQAEGTWSLWKSGNDGNNQESEANKPRLRRMGNERVPIHRRVFGNGYADTTGDGQNDGDGRLHYLRPSLIQLLESRSILIEGVSLRGSPFWTVHPVLCENVIIRGLTIRPGTTNDDGINPESSRFVLIEDNDIMTDDDAIALKAGRDAEGRAYPGTAFVVIRGNRLRSTVGGALSIGSEMSGGVEWVFIEDVIAENERGRGLYIKSNLDRGGFVRHIYVRRMNVLSAVQGFEVTSDYHGYRGGQEPTNVHDVVLRDVRIWNTTEHALRLLGQEAAPVFRIALFNVSIRGAEQAHLRHTRDLVAETVRFNGRNWRPHVADD